MLQVLTAPLPYKVDGAGHMIVSARMVVLPVRTDGGGKEHCRIYKTGVPS